MVHGASTIYSDDPDIAAHGKDCGITVLALADLPLPSSRQMTIEETLREESAANKATVSLSAGAPEAAGVEAEIVPGEEEVDLRSEFSTLAEGEEPADDNPPDKGRDTKT
jgi:hypothetical protein